MTLDKLMRLFECEFPPPSNKFTVLPSFPDPKCHQEHQTTVSLAHGDSDSICLDQPVQQHVVWASHVVSNVLAATFFKKKHKDISEVNSNLFFDAMY